MPSAAYTRLSPSDLVSLISFLKRAEPVVRDFAPKRMGPLGHMLVATGTYKLAAERVPVEVVPQPNELIYLGTYLHRECVDS